MADPSDGAPSVRFEALAPQEAPPYAVKLPVFEGPLDLLLHLIRLNEVDVADIPIALIAEQYLEYLQLMHELDLDVAGEYLLMAATLAWIKSRMLLPAEAGEEDEEGLDPRAELVARLLEYQRFKEAAGELGELPRLGRDVFRAETPGVETTRADREIEVGLFDLLAAMRLVLAQARARDAIHEVESEPVTVHQQMEFVMGVASRTDSVAFLDLFRDEMGRVASRAVILTSFLALLELARLGALQLFQGVSASGAPEGPIRVRATEKGLGEGWAEHVCELV